LSPLKEIPVSIDQRFSWFLHGGIHPNSKSGAAFRELVEAGIKPESIWHLDLNGNNKLIGIFRVLSRLPWVTGLIIQKIKVFRYIDLAALQVLIGYAAYKRFFLENSKLKPVIISDISPTLHMQWSAALSVNSEVLWWQDDYHHFEGFSEENYLPYTCDFAIVLNEHGYKTVKSQSPEAKIFRRKPTNVFPLRKIPNNPKIGMATNVLFEATPAQLEIVKELKERLSASEIFLRLHPNSKLHSAKSLPKWLCIAKKRETLEGFAQRIDLVIVGNTAAQLKLLCLSVPVLHVTLFDNFGSDLYQYCRLGFSYGVEDLGKLNMEDVHKFYSEKFKSRSLEEYVNIQSEVNELKALPIFF
jgi:hypothetical protein